MSESVPHLGESSPTVKQLSCVSSNQFRCSDCAEVFDNALRYPHTKKCKPCYGKRTAIWRKKNLEKTRAYSREWGRRNTGSAHKHKLANRYGMTPLEYQAIVDAQGGVCAICGKPETRTDHRTGRVQMLSVDHDHITGKNRGLLCNLCNRGIGLFLDDRLILKRASEYLDRYDFTPPGLEIADRVSPKRAKRLFAQLRAKIEKAS